MHAGPRCPQRNHVSTYCGWPSNGVGDHAEQGSVQRWAQSDAEGHANRQKSSFTSSETCVEVAAIPGGVLVCNSSAPEAGTLEFTRAEFSAWLEGCKAGEFDDLAV
ncbi:DUF397 domain-containing protein [Nocardia amamiensis]|uniref:DUF397 domain-containing protein n=1 Tax=Nocardia amamiensis TaxID=404578 RepID=UPI0009FE6F12|nr:DUF397 domain-containing protein [Nocardia amamiensis]